MDEEDKAMRQKQQREREALRKKQEEEKVQREIHILKRKISSFVF